jgi:ATP-dependent helicase HrpB
LLQSTEQWLLPYLLNVNSLAKLKQVNVFELIKGRLSWDEQQLLEREAPLVYITPSDKKIPIVYDKNKGPTVSVRLQEMFGEIESPKIGANTVPLRFELLSPAQRPIQTTSDLANFWNTSYIEVAKEMRGKYPRHRWPEKPLLEKPGHSIKHRRR